MQIKANDIWLDVPRGTNLSFTRKNNALNFGSIELERTLSFKLPITRKNEEAFSIAEDYHNIGTQARKRIECEILLDSVVLNGLLYLSKCERDSYECVFVFGDLMPLKAMSESGEVENTYFDNYEDTFFLNQPIRADEDADVFALRKYKNENGELWKEEYILPCWQLSKFFDPTRNGFNITLDFSDVSIFDDKDVVLIADKINYSNVEVVTGIIFDYAPNGLGNRMLNFTNAPAILDKGPTNSEWIENGTTMSNNEVFFRFSEDADLQFPNDFPDDLFICDAKLAFVPDEQDGQFYGDYSFSMDEAFDAVEDANRPTYGTPLAGRTISLPKNTQFCFVAKSSYHFYYGVMMNHGFFGGWYFPYNFWFNTIRILTPEQVKESPQPGSLTNIGLENNYPKMTYIDILQTLRMLSGSFFSYVPSTGKIKFTEYDIENWTERTLSDAVKVSDINRKVGDFAQQNTVEFDSDEYVNLPIKQVYEIDNANITANKTLYKYKGSEGTTTEDGEVRLVDVEREIKTEKNAYDVDVQVTYIKAIGKKPTFALISKTANTAEYLLYIGTNGFAERINAIDKICEESTSIKVVALMSEYEYFSIKENEIIWFDGCRWLWRSAQWSKGKVTLELQKYE